MAGMYLKEYKILESEANWAIKNKAESLKQNTWKNLMKNLYCRTVHKSTPVEDVDSH